MLRFGMLLLALPSIVLITLYMFEAQAVAACEQSGGHWDFAKALCDMHNTPEFIPYAARHGMLVGIGMLLSMLGLVMTTLGMIAKGMAKPKDRA